jgi:SPP1 gp7 family putative phage head morphogenesis protein
MPFFSLPGTITPEWYKSVKATLQLDADDDEAEQRIRERLERRSTREIQDGLQEILDRINGAAGDWDTVDDFRREFTQEMYRSQALTDAIDRTVLDGADLGVSVAVDQLENVGLGFDWTLANTAARDWAARYSSELIQGIDQTNIRMTQQAVARWIENGEPLEALINDLAPVYGRQRAQLIASTEVTRSFAEANRIGYLESGVVNQLEWRTAEDERVCPICGPLNGQRQPSRSPNFDGVGIPPAHPRCRCWLVPVV